MSTAPVSYDKADPIIDRLEDQIDWYNAKSSKSQRTYRRIKLIEIVSAALIPFLSALHISGSSAPAPGSFWAQYPYLTLGTFTALLGVLITVLEGVLQLNQYQQIWVTYRATCEALKHEKFTYLAKAGVYAAAIDPRALLAERVETIGSQENTKWASLQQPLKIGTHGSGDREPG